MRLRYRLHVLPIRPTAWGLKPTPTHQSLRVTGPRHCQSPFPPTAVDTSLDAPPGRRAGVLYLYYLCTSVPLSLVVSQVHVDVASRPDENGPGSQDGAPARELGVPMGPCVLERERSRTVGCLGCFSSRPARPRTSLHALLVDRSFRGSSTLSRRRHLRSRAIHYGMPRQERGRQASTAGPALVELLSDADKSSGARPLATGEPMPMPEPCMSHV